MGNLRKMVFGILIVMLTGCATNRVKNVSEAASDNDLKTGVYKNAKGENLHVNVVNLKERNDDLEKSLSDKDREIEHLRKERQRLHEEVLVLKATKGLPTKEESPQVAGFDAENNPIMKVKTDTPTP